MITLIYQDFHSKRLVVIHQYSYNNLIGHLTYDSRIVLNSNHKIEWKNKYEGSY